MLVNLTRRCLKSPAIITVIALTAVDCALSLGNPLEKLNSTGFTGINQYFVVSKLGKFLKSNSSPDVILTGSSLFLNPSVRCDEALAGKPPRNDPAYIRDFVDSYQNCNYLEKLLFKALGSSVKVSNLATAGGLLSDQYFVFKKCISSGKRPKVLVCDISPREFIDNNQPDPKKTPVYLSTNSSATFSELLEEKAEFPAVFQALAGKYWGFLKDRSDYREFLVNYTANSLHHPTSLFQAKTTQNSVTTPNLKQIQTTPSKQEEQNNHQLSGIPSSIPPQIKKGEAEYYSHTYLPINRKLEELEFSYLDKLLALAQKEDIPVVLVSMPLPLVNRDILPKDYLKAFYQRVAETGKKHKAIYVPPPDSTEYPDSDFEDMAHLGLKGGRKLFNSLTDILAQNLKSDSTQVSAKASNNF